jgi:hypothetical protein
LVKSFTSGKKEWTGKSHRPVGRIQRSSKRTELGRGRGREGGEGEWEEEGMDRIKPSARGMNPDVSKRTELRRGEGKEEGKDEGLLVQLIHSKKAANMHSLSLLLLSSLPPSLPSFPPYLCGPKSSIHIMVPKRRIKYAPYLPGNCKK